MKKILNALQDNLMNKEEIQKQIKLMTEYAQMMLERGDYHGLWDAAIDLQRLNDKLQLTLDLAPNGASWVQGGVMDLNQNPIKKQGIADHKCIKCGVDDESVIMNLLEMTRGIQVCNDCWRKTQQECQHSFKPLGANQLRCIKCNGIRFK